ncbi:flagellar FliJ family protein [Sulfurimonas sp. SAG-AH-194-I05]|nr:flagellar FliJ family protein [Sulfurimonas sp. SAG-AH-194-I05]
MQRSEETLQNANRDLKSALEALDISYKLLSDVASPQSGKVGEMLAARTLFDSQRGVIEHNKEWVSFKEVQVRQAKEQLKLDMIEYEKFHYLELEEIKKILQEKKIQEAKDLDEIALMIHAKKSKVKEDI